MPQNIDETRWQKAKSIAAGSGAAPEKGTDAWWAYVRGVYNRMGGARGAGGRRPFDSGEVVSKLLDLKAASDRGDFGTKHARFRRLLKERPREFKIDSRKGSVYGVTHLPTGFRFHVPASEMPAQWRRSALNKTASALISVWLGTSGVSKSAAAPETPEQRRARVMAEVAHARKALSPEDFSRYLSRKVVASLGGGVLAEKLMHGTAATESGYGTDDRTYRPGYYGGMFQVDRIGYRDTMDTTSHEKLPLRYEKILRDFGIDWTKTTWEDMRDPLHSAIAARLLYLNHEDPIPDTRLERARYWKKHYNSHHENAKGEVQDYIDRSNPSFSYDPKRSAPGSPAAMPA